jgi:zinc protease
MKAIIYREIDKIKANGPTATDLDKAVESLLKNREQSKLHNIYWLQSLNTYYMYSYDPTSAKNFEQVLQKMTAAQVQKFVQSFLAKADVVDIIFKPKP